jgi:hypothetical protein
MASIKSGINSQKKPVTKILSSLTKRASKIGCVLVIHPHEFMPYNVIGIIPENPISLERFTLGVTDGAVHVIANHCDMDKLAANSRYFKLLVELESKFEECRNGLQELEKQYKINHPYQTKHQK